MHSEWCVSCVLYSQGLFKIFGIRDFLPSDFIIHWLAKYVCSLEDLETFCSDIIFVIAGFDKKQLNEVRTEKDIKINAMIGWLHTGREQGAKAAKTTKPSKTLLENHF